MTGEPIEVRPGAMRRGRNDAASGWSYRPRLDASEDADELTIRADLPGVAPDDIQVSFEQQTLSIHGAVRARQDPEVEYLMHEYGIGDFDRELYLPETVDVERISAEYAHGVLTVHLPKSEKSKPRRIPVRAV